MAGAAYVARQRSCQGDMCGKGACMAEGDVCDRGRTSQGDVCGRRGMHGCGVGVCVAGGMYSRG